MKVMLVGPPAAAATRAAEVGVKVYVPALVMLTVPVEGWVTL
jgi:hypothetical protein